MSVTSQLTSRQKAVYEMIRECILSRGYGPTVREIGEHFNIKSPNGVMCHLKALQRKGLIKRSPNKSRAIELAHAAERSTTSFPLAGLVAAGPTTLAFEQDERVDLADLFYRDDRYVLQVSGDSMIEAHIADGDYVIVQKQQTASRGDMVIAQTADGEATLKYWFPEADHIRLEPANREMEPIRVRNASVIGKVVGVVRTVR